MLLFGAALFSLLLSLPECPPLFQQCLVLVSFHQVNESTKSIFVSHCTGLVAVQELDAPAALELVTALSHEGSLPEVSSLSPASP